PPGVRLPRPPGSDPEDIRSFIAGNLTAGHFAAPIRAVDRTVLWARDGDGTPVAYCLLVHDSQPTSSEPASLRHGPTVELDTFSVHADRVA
ncbi:MAG: hypothetical protein MOP51_2938, partial [Citricoccus sp.]|nr:hypothetical protein [Citricoccus sp. WCRC_4]